MRETCEVSVLVPVYNGERFLRAAVESVLAQTLSDIEIIIVDDASTDGSRELIAQIPDRRIHIFVNTVNRGLVGNWNACLEKARGRYITMLHQDDTMEPGNLDRKVSALKASGKAWVASDCRQIDAADRFIFEHWFGHNRALSQVGQPRRVQFNAMFFGVNYVCFPTILWKREVTDQLGGFEEKGGLCADIYMWLKFLSRFEMEYLDETLIRYRWAQNESLKYDTSQWLRDEFAAKRHAARDFGLSYGELFRLRAVYGYRFLRQSVKQFVYGDWSGARKTLSGVNILRS